jgi:shikimate kinase
MIVVLIGYMGVGKTSVGKNIADLLGYEFVDLDEYISDSEKVSISEIFKAKGEVYFRQKESQYLRDLVQSKNDMVLALGGGTPCYANNMDLLKMSTHVTSFYLKLSINSLSERLISEQNGRPLIAHLKSKEDLIEFIGKHLFERNNFYTMADHIIDVENLSVEQISGAVAAKLV